MLRAGGHFLYADSQPPSGIAAWETALADAPMRMVSQRVINAEVMRGMEKNSQRWLDVIARRTPAFLHGLARDVAGVRDSSAYHDLQSGSFEYRMYCFVNE